MSTIKVNKIENTGTTDGGVEIDSSGHVKVDGLQIPTVGALSNRNIIINGAMQVNQRGTVTGITSSQYGACDRWKTVNSSLGTWTASQVTSSPSGFSNAFRLDCTTAEPSPTANGYIIAMYHIEGQDVQHLNYGSSDAQALTLSFYVRSNKTGAASFEIQQRDNSDKQFIKSYTISAANTWEKKTITIPADTAGLINNDNGEGLRLGWWLNSGSTYTGGSAPSGWESETNANRNANNLGVGGSTSDYFEITGVQLEVGEKATPFEHRSYGDELARCKRYFELLTNDVAGTKLSRKLFGPGYFESSTQGVAYISFAEKRAAPTVTASGTGDFIMFHTGSSVALTGLTFAQSSPTDVRADTTCSSGPYSDGDSCFLTSISGSTLSTISLDSEL